MNFIKLRFLCDFHPDDEPAQPYPYAMGGLEHKTSITAQ
jgi:hypothetical protein